MVHNAKLKCKQMYNIFLLRAMFHKSYDTIM